MGWKISRYASSLISLLRDTNEGDSTAAGNRLENARDAMLDLLSEVLEGQVVKPAVWGQVLYARDLESLWYQRSEVMSLLSKHMGETTARERVAALSPLFKEVQLGRKTSAPKRPSKA